MKSRLNAHRNEKTEDKCVIGDSNQTTKEGDKGDERRGTIKKEDDKPFRSINLHMKEDQWTDPQHNPSRPNVEVEENRLKEKLKEPLKPSPLRAVRRKDLDVLPSRTASKIKVSRLSA